MSEGFKGKKQNIFDYVALHLSAHTAAGSGRVCVHAVLALGEKLWLAE